MWPSTEHPQSDLYQLGGVIGLSGWLPLDNKAKEVRSHNVSN